MHDLCQVLSDSYSRLARVIGVTADAFFLILRSVVRDAHNCIAQQFTILDTNARSKCRHADAEFANILANAGEVSELLLESGEGQITSGAAAATPGSAGVPPKHAHGPERIAGLLVAVMAGLFGGLVLAPMYFSNLSGLGFVPSMSMGAGCASPLTLLAGRLMREPAAASAESAEMYSSLKAHAPVSQQRWWAAAAIAMGSGVLWNFGNICSIVATKEVRQLTARAVP